MTEQDKTNSGTQMKLAVQDAKFAVFMSELKEQREDIRRLNEKHDADMKEMRSEIRDALKNLQGLTVAAVVGITAIAVGVLGFLWSSTNNQTIQHVPPAQTQTAQ